MYGSPVCMQCATYNQPFLVLLVVVHIPAYILDSRWQWYYCTLTVWVQQTYLRLPVSASLSLHICPQFCCLLPALPNDIIVKHWWHLFFCHFSSCLADHTRLFTVGDGLLSFYMDFASHFTSVTLTPPVWPPPFPPQPVIRVNHISQWSQLSNFYFCCCC